MDALSGLIIGSVVAVALAAFQLISRVLDKKSGKTTELPPDVKAAIFDTARNGRILVKQHAPEGGVERWKWSDELTTIIRAVGETQRIQTVLMEKWDVNLERHRDREETVLTEIRDTLRDISQELK